MVDTLKRTNSVIQDDDLLNEGPGKVTYMDKEQTNTQTHKNCSQ